MLQVDDLDVRFWHLTETCVAAVSLIGSNVVILGQASTSRRTRRGVVDPMTGVGRHCSGAITIGDFGDLANRRVVLLLGADRVEGLGQ